MAVYDPEAPIVTALEDGTLVQRTPSANTETYGDLQNNMTRGLYYNTAVLKADARGCNACHSDLGQTIEGYAAMTGYRMLNLTNGLHTEITVQTCLGCHFTGNWKGELGPAIHGIHNVDSAEPAKATCFNCHDTEDGTMVLWDVVKHDRLGAITSVENVAGDFSFSQEETVPVDTLFQPQWIGNPDDAVRVENALNDIPLDEAMFDTWQITVSGEVDQEVTFNLTDLINEAPSVTTTMKSQCEINPTGGPFIGQVEVTGIPVSWLLEKAGLKDDAVSCQFQCADGYSEYYRMDIADMDDHPCLLVYEIDGERLTWKNGYPVAVWMGGRTASMNVMQVCQLTVFNSSQNPVNDKSNVGVMKTVEGQIIQAGEPYTFHGYADAWDDPIAAVEFSMDGGETWTHFATPDTNDNQWVTWDFTWTPAADVDTAYVLQIRSVSVRGLVTATPLEIMVNAKSDVSGIEVK